MSACSIYPGFGGHINRDDHIVGKNWKDWIMAGMRREVEEELPGIDLSQEPQLLGIINEEHTEVGKVHLGIVFSLKLGSIPCRLPDDELSELIWIDDITLSTLCSQHELEKWSELALRLIG